MAKIILHIGTHKTATTTIQDTFHGNTSLLAANGVIYPRYNRITGHHGLVFDWGSLPNVYRLSGGSREQLAKLVRDYADGDATVFLSSEEFSRAAEDARVDFTELRQILAPFDKIQVVCTVRIQWQFLQSIYLELGKKRQPPKPGVVVRQSIRHKRFAGLWIDYNQLYDMLLESFGPDEITFLDYATICKAEGGVLRTMLDLAGTDLPVENLKTIKKSRSNVSPVPLVAWAANTLAEPHPARPWIAELAQAAMDEVYEPGVRTCLFATTELAQLEEFFGPLNTQFNERLAPYQPGFKVTDPGFGGIDVFRNQIDSRFWRNCARRLVAGRL